MTPRPGLLRGSKIKNYKGSNALRVTWSPPPGFSSLGALVNEVHGVAVNADTLGSEGGDRGSRGVHADEMHGDIAVQFEGRRDGERGGERAAERVDEHVDGFPGILAENEVNIVAVEVVASDEAFEMEIIFLCRAKRLRR